MCPQLDVAGLVSAIRPPPGAAASASGYPASRVSSRPDWAHFAPLSLLLASGEKDRSWLGRIAAARAGPPSAATVIPPLLAAPGGVASFQAAAWPGRTNTCQKLLWSAADPPITSTAQLPSG